MSKSKPSAEDMLASLPWRRSNLGDSKEQKVLFEGQARTTSGSFHYLHNQQARSPVLLLLHGFGANCQIWAPWLQELGGRFSAMAIDLLGFGLSRPATSLVTIDGQVEGLHELAAKLKIGPLHVLGHSLGALIAYRWAQRLPEDLGSLVIIAPPSFESGLPLPLRIALRNRFIARLAAMAAIPRRRKTIEKRLRRKMNTNDAIPSWVLDAYEYGLSQPQCLDGLVANLIGLQEKMAFDETAPAFRPPVLLIEGERDTERSESTIARWRQLAPQLRRVLLAGCGHYPHFQQPQECLSQIHEFLGGVFSQNRDDRT